MTSKRTKQQPDAKYQERARYMHWVESVLGSLLPEFRLPNSPVLRAHHCGPFSGAPGDFYIAFIFATRAASDETASAGTVTFAASRVLSLLRAQGYPDDALAWFRFEAVSEEDIDAAGGDFNYWR